MTEGPVVSVVVQFSLSLFPVCMTGPSSTNISNHMTLEFFPGSISFRRKVMPCLSVDNVQLETEHCFINVSSERYDGGKGPYPQVVVQGLDAALSPGLQALQDGHSHQHNDGAAGGLSVGGSVVQRMAEV